MAAIDEYLVAMLHEGGSDLHIHEGKIPRMRVSGSLLELDTPALSTSEIRDMLCEICTEHRWATYLSVGETDLAYEIPDVSRFRVNLLTSNYGMGAVFRQIPTRVMSLDELQLPKALRKFIPLRDGLVLVTGPTGSGKSTTLAAILNEMNLHTHRKILTIEDPVEFVHTDQNSVFLHREVGEQCVSFQRALEGTMRADADVVLLGEMRDSETMKLALSCATMGMLVFATLHTNDAAKSIDRIVDAFPADEQNQVRVMLADSLKGVVSQLLCKKLDGGRLAVHEILLSHEALGHTIRQHNLSNLRNIISQNRSEGMISMDVSIRTAYDKGLISAEEAFMKAIDKREFVGLLKQPAQTQTGKKGKRK